MVKSKILKFVDSPETQKPRDIKKILRPNYYYFHQIKNWLQGFWLVLLKLFNFEGDWILDSASIWF